MNADNFYVCVISRTLDSKVQDALAGFYSQIEQASLDQTIRGLLSMQATLPNNTLDQWLADKPQLLIDAVYDTPLRGMVIFTQWENGASIDNFCKGNLHTMLSDYVYQEGSHTILTVIQYRDRKVTKRDIKGRFG